MPATGAPAMPAAAGWMLRRELTSRGAVLVTGVLLAVTAWLSVQVGGHLGAFFGICFVLVSLTGALAVDDRALFTAAVLPPLALTAVLLAAAVLAPGVVAADTVPVTAGPVARAVAGVVGLAPALVLGHLATLAVVGARVSARLRASPRPCSVPSGGA